MKEKDCLVLVNRYPSYENLYQNAFVHRRVKNYISKGVSLDVFSLDQYFPRPFMKYEFDGVGVYTGSKKDLYNLITDNMYKKILIHFINPVMFEVVQEFLDKLQVIIWLHGADVQPWYRRMFNYKDNDELEKAISLSNTRTAFMKNVFNNPSPNLHFVFVSDTFRKSVFEDYDLLLDKDKYSVIHNIIDTELFRYIPKPAEQRKKILSIRPFASRTYANDLSVKAILELSKEEYFSDLDIAIYGKGLLFKDTVAPLKKFKNVKIYEQFLEQSEIAELHREYGVFLVPSRMDSHGVSRDEAMASGLVPVTNNVAAIPEFVDNSCAMLADSEDYLGLAKGISYLYHNPFEFLVKSKNAAERVRRQSGKEVVLQKELNLILQE